MIVPATVVVPDGWIGFLLLVLLILAIVFLIRRL